MKTLILKALVKCKKYTNNRNRQIWSNFYGNMFIEDFAAHLTYELSLTYSRDNLYITQIGTKGNLCNAISKNKHIYFDYDFSEMINQIATSLIVSGKAYIEFELKEDQDKKYELNMKQLRNEDVLWNNSRHCYVNKPSYGSEISIRRIDINNILILRYKEINGVSINNRRRKTLGKRLGAINHLEMTKLFTNKDSGFDFVQYKRKEAISILEATDGVRWNGRDVSSEYYTQPYKIINIARMKKSQVNLHSYIIEKINNKIHQIDLQSLFKNDDIVYKTLTSSQIDEIIDGIYNGEMTFTDAVEYLLVNKEYRGAQE